MNSPSHVLALLIGVAIVAWWVFLHRWLVRDRNPTSLTLLARIAQASPYTFLGAVATSLLCVLPSSPAAFTDGRFRILAGAPLIWALTSAHWMPAFVVLIFAAAAIGFQLLWNRAGQSRAFRRFLRELPPSSGRVQSEATGRYPPAPPPPGPDAP
jgi:hypothetical protein